MSSARTIAAIATALGPGAIGIVRLTGPRCAEISAKLIGKLPPPRYAALVTLRDCEGIPIDRGIVIHFPGPRSYTGEDVVEFQVHGGQVVVDRVLKALYAAGAAPAMAGEFTQRAFLNGKLDLLQAEAVADLVAASTERAARAAIEAASGRFSTLFRDVSLGLVQTRMRVEALIDFSDDLDSDAEHASLLQTVAALRAALATLRARAAQGAMLAQGVRAVLVGPPNAGKSSLLNALAGQPRAIVSERPGTTRDVLSQDIEIEGLRLTITDTAGLHETQDELEREGMRRALGEVSRADLLLCLYDATQPRPSLATLLGDLPRPDAVLYVRNKIDLLPDGEAAVVDSDHPAVSVSAHTGQGLETLCAEMLRLLGVRSEADSPMLARSRHLHALDVADRLLDFDDARELVRDAAAFAERLRLAHRAVGELTGEFTNEDLLGEIFARFCIGK